jgi:hypothetical protein
LIRAHSEAAGILRISKHDSNMGEFDRRVRFKSGLRHS